MSQPKPIRIAILGVGGIARKAYLPLLRTWPGVKIVGVGSRTTQTVEKVCADWQIDFGTTSVEALLDQKPQAVFVLSPTLKHAEHARLLLEAGVDVFLEKPATESSRLTWQLVELARQKERLLMVGFNRRSALLYRQAKDIFAGRPIQLCIAEKHRPSAFHVSLYNNYLDDTIHQIDLLRFFCGELAPQHTAFQMQDGHLVGAASSLTIQQGGGMGLLQTSLQAGTWQERLTLHGSGLTVEVDAFRELRVKEGAKVEVFGRDRPGRWLSGLEERGFSGEIRQFFECLQTRQQPASDGINAARTQELVEKLVAITGESTQMVPYETPYA